MQMDPQNSKGWVARVPRPYSQVTRKSRPRPDVPGEVRAKDLLGSGRLMNREDRTQYRGNFAPRARVHHKEEANKKVVRDHIQMAKLLDAIEAIGEELENSQTEFVECLGELSVLLCRHHQQEERSSFYQIISELEPRFAQQLEVLLNEHEAIQSFLTGVRKSEVGVLRIRVRAALQATRKLVAMIRRHECEETQILWQAVYLEDIGGVD